MEHLITDDTDSAGQDEPYQPAPLVTAAIMTFCGFMTFLALWKFAEILGDVYQWSIG